jgi:uncharacterized protein PF11_0207
MLKGLVKVGLVGLAGYGVYKLAQYSFGLGLVMGNKDIAKTSYDVTHGNISKEEGRSKIEDIIKANMDESNEYLKELKEEIKDFKESVKETVEEVKEEAANVVENVEDTVKA